MHDLWVASYVINNLSAEYVEVILNLLDGVFLYHNQHWEIIGLAGS